MADVTFLCLVFSLITKLNAAKILIVVPTPSISHQFVFRVLTQELARIGHEVIIITTDPSFKKNQAPPNLTEIDTHDISYRTWENELRNIKVGDKNDMIKQIEMFTHLLGSIIGQQLKMKEIQDLIQRKPHFDLIIAELCTRPAIIFSHIFNAPIILMGSFGPMIGTNGVVGAPNHPLLQPVVGRQRLYNLTMWEKIREIYYQIRFEHLYSTNEDKENAMLKEILGDDIPTLSELYNKVNVVFLNVHPIWNDNQPVPPGVVYIGGIHQNPAKKIPKDLESYLNSSKHGVIYLSFGTNVQHSVIPPDKVKMMIKVFSELPYNVIWKWDIELPNKPNNIKIFKWLPQPDLLRHPNIKLFITQGGLQSTDEAITGGVPLIGIPIIGDQWYNVEKYIKHGIGKKLEMGEFTEEEFKNTIIEVIEDHSYKNNIIRLRTMMRDEPLTPLQRAIWWTEHVIRHGGARHVRSPAANMPWSEYYELNLVLILFAVSLGIVIITYVTLCYIKRYIVVNILPSIIIKLKVL